MNILITFSLSLVPEWRGEFEFSLEFDKKYCEIRRKQHGFHFNNNS